MISTATSYRSGLVRVGDASKSGVVSFVPPVERPADSPYVRLNMTLLKAEEGPEGKLADAEFVFIEPPLQGSMWGTFTVWQRKGKQGGVRVSGPGRVWTDSSQKDHFVPFVRSINPNIDGLPPSVLRLVLATFEKATHSALASR